MRRAFTLLELLIVIGVVAALAALLLPAIARTREESRSVKCLANLRQLGQAALQYAQASDGSFPISTYDNSLDWDFDLRSGSAKPGILWIGATTLAIQQCPSFDRRGSLDVVPYLGYNYNTSYIGGGVGEVTPLNHPHIAPARVQSIRNAPGVALFGDGQYSAGADKFMRAPVLMAGTDIGDGVGFFTRTAGTQGYRHVGRTNVCYADAHAESVSARFTATGISSNGVVSVSNVAAAAGTGFLSSGNGAYGGNP